MGYMDKYREWLEKADEATVAELETIRGNETEIEDRFYKSLEFGTAGLRGIMGAGTNRMNKYVLMQATRALADVVLEAGGKDRGVAIAHDCRINSRVYAETCAAIFYSKGIKAYIFEDLRPTPELSYAIRKLGTISGVNVTASHNPQEYNGYKVYWEEGSQILDDIADRILEKISTTELFDPEGIPSFEEGVNKGLITILGEEMDRMYLDDVKGLALNDEGIDKSVSAVYTPLNGTGAVLVPRILSERGFKNIYLVKEQLEPDGHFPTTPYPNPEDFSTFEIALKYAKEHDSELCVATDPDADRIAIMVREGNDNYIPMNGNQTGALLLQYILEQRHIKGMASDKDAMVTTIVTGDLGKEIARKYGLKVYETLTGFKHVCGKANEFYKTGEANYVFGYEESIGYCPETFVRDKDAVSTAMLLFEMAAYYKSRGKTLLDVLNEIYEEYGHYRESQFSIVYKGVDGAELKEKVIDAWRDGYPKSIAGEKLTAVTDYLISEHTDLVTGAKSSVDIPKSDVMKFKFDGGTWYAIRPSGTEPKLKFYIYTVKDSEEKAFGSLDGFEKELRSQIGIFEKS
ncbi:MAG: phospho-sugar mutase [Clostridia bacterium]|nr:phospho-sugar mutase [Clostridia bacterium]